MKNKETPRRFNWNLLLTTISTIAAVLSVVSAFLANKIAQESQLPDPLIAYIGQFRDYYDDYDYKAPYKTQSGSAYWQIEFAVVFDVSNFGGKAISLVGIDYDRIIETFYPLIQATIDYEFFGNWEKLDTLLSAKSCQPHAPELASGRFGPYKMTCLGVQNGLCCCCFGHFWASRQVSFGQMPCH